MVEHPLGEAVGGSAAALVWAAPAARRFLLYNQTTDLTSP